MKRIDLGTSGETEQPGGPQWHDLDLPPPWPTVISLLTPKSQPTDIQAKALGRLNILAARRNLIVSSPTNSGKSLLGYILLLEALASGRRALLLEPLRCIAQEKYEELSASLPQISDLLGHKLSLTITTGDYRLDHETMHSPPPDGGQIVIATPERIEAILRNPDFDPWVRSFGALCADEAHLLSCPRRGPALEFVLTNFLLAKSPPRIALLSGTLGDTSKALAWLHPCDLALSSIRRPPLSRSILQLDADEDADNTVAAVLAPALSDPHHSALIFTYQTASTARLAAFLSDKLGPLCGPTGALPYHAKMTRAARTDVRARYLAGQSRCLVSTTALAAGVNLPATHLVIRDLTFHGSGPVPLDQLIQMTGRAGRGANPGHAFLIHRPSDAWDINDLSNGLQSQRLPDLASALVPQPPTNGRNHRNAGAPESSAENSAEFVLSLLARSRDSAMSSDQLNQFVSRSLAGPDLVPHLDAAIRWLTEPSRLLAFRQEDDSLIPTSLGLAAARSSLPLPLAAALAQLIRDLLSLGAEDSVLHAWGELDHLLVLELLADRTWSLRPFSADLAAKVDDAMERSPSKSILYTQWIRGAQGHSKAVELLGSLGISQEKSHANSEEWCRRRAYSALFRATILHQRAHGASAENLSRNWGIEDISGLEEGWRDHRLWLLGAITELFDIKCFYYHLRSDCGADDARVLRVKRHLQRLRLLALQTAARVKHCSPLGPLLVQMRDGRGASPGVGQKTIEKLEALGVGNLAEITRLTPDDFKKVGISTPITNRLLSYARRRLA